jgi:hypothetical protein
MTIGRCKPTNELIDWLCKLINEYQKNVYFFGIEGFPSVQDERMTAVIKKSTVFWKMTPYSLLFGYGKV